MTARRERGSYAKGIAKRDEILTRALEVIAREGYRGASVKEIARAAGLSQAGLLHYFDSKEHLFTEILRKRDEVDAPAVFAAANGADFRSRFAAVIRHNAEVPGLVQLFSQLAVDATDPSHPAHAYFVERGEALRAVLAAEIAGRPLDAGTDGAVGGTDGHDDPWARILQAASDGLQLQWMLDPTIDMAATIETLLAAIPEPSRSAAGR